MNILYIGNFLSRHKGYYAGPNKRLVESFLRNGYNVKYASQKLNWFSRFFDFVLLIWKYRKQTDIVIIDTYSSYAFFFAISIAWECKWLGLNYIPVLHGGNLPWRLDKSKKASYTYLTNATKIVAPSGYLQQTVIKRNLGIPVVIPNPIELNRYTYKHRQVCSPKLLWVRSLKELYNPMMALHVLKALKQSNPSAHLYMVGPDVTNMGNDLHKFVKSNDLLENVTFTGKLSLDDWTRLSSKCDIFINTTNVDNTPVSVIEAMALGMPVVSTNVGGIPYLIKDGHDGLICNVGDADDMLLKINALINNSSLVTKISQNARHSVENEYDSEKVMSKWKALLDSEKASSNSRLGRFQ